MMRLRRFLRPHSLFALVCGSAMCFSAAWAQADSPWVSTAQSAGSHPIQVARFGNGPQNVLVVGSLTGNDPETLKLMDAVCEISRQYPPPEPITLLFVRTLNPDGAADLVHTNARGVELNRNFPSPYFTSIPNRLTGPSPASEVETQYMLRVLEEYKPVRVIHVRGGVGEQPLAVVNEAWRSHGREPVLPGHVHLGYFDHSFKAGSLEEYASCQLQTSVATVQLSATGGQQMQAGELLRFATGQLPGNSPADSLAQQTNKPPVTPEARPVATIPESRLGMPPATGTAATGANGAPPSSARGEVEFLPTPPEFLTTGRQEAGGDKRNGEYFELPPPPRR